MGQCALACGDNPSLGADGKHECGPVGSLKAIGGCPVLVRERRQWVHQAAALSGISSVMSQASTSARVQSVSGVVPRLPFSSRKMWLGCNPALLPRPGPLDPAPEAPDPSLSRPT